MINDAVVRLRVLGDALEPDEVTVMLGHPPTVAYRKGELQHDAGRLALPARTGMWILESDRPRNAPVDDQISELLQRVTDEPSVWDRLRTRFHTDIRCGVFMTSDNQGLTLPTAVVADLARRYLGLELDIYAD